MADAILARSVSAPVLPAISISGLDADARSQGKSSSCRIRRACSSPKTCLGNPCFSPGSSPALHRSPSTSMSLTQPPHGNGFYSTSAPQGSWSSGQVFPSPSSFSMHQGAQIRKRESSPREFLLHGSQQRPHASLQRLRHRTVSEMDLGNTSSSMGADDVLSPLFTTSDLPASSFSSRSSPSSEFDSNAVVGREEPSSDVVHPGAYDVNMSPYDESRQWRDQAANLEDSVSMSRYPEPDLSSSTPLVFMAPSSVYTCMGTPEFLVTDLLSHDTPWLDSISCDSASTRTDDTADFFFHHMERNGGRDGSSSSVSERVDGELYTMIAHGPNGMTIACNAHGCRPIWTEDAEKRPSEWMLSGKTMPGGASPSVAQFPECPSRTQECEVGSVCFCSKPMLPRHHLGGSPEEEHKVQEMDDMYQQTLQEDPGNALFLRNYAQFLYEVKGDYFAADSAFQKAVHAAPADGELLVLYAKFLWEGICDADKASSMFQQAVEVSPDNCYVLAAHAAFLWDADNLLEQTSVLAPPFPPPQTVEL